MTSGKADGESREPCPNHEDERIAAPSQAVWEHLFAAGALSLCLSPSDASLCPGVCRTWRCLTSHTVLPIELWSSDVGPERRAEAWNQLLLGGITLRARTPQDCYEALVETASPYDNAIRRDVGRTLPQEDLFREKGGPGQSSLFRVLRALAIRLWDIGYCQSLNFIVATLIGVFPNDEASVFHCAVALLLRHALVDLYRPKFPKLGVVIWQFDRIVEGFLPKVHAQLQRHGVNAEYYAIQWFLTLFAGELSQDVVRRIWDRFLVAGWRVVVQVSLALLYTIQDVLPTLDTCSALCFLRKFARTKQFDAEELLDTASSFEVSHQMLSALEASYSWTYEVQLIVVKDLNTGNVHWAIQALPPTPPCSDPPYGNADVPGEEEMSIPRAFNRASMDPQQASGVGGSADAAAGPERSHGTVLPFLVHDLDTGKTTVLERAWSQYMREVHDKARAQTGAPPRQPQQQQHSAPVPVPDLRPALDTPVRQWTNRGNRRETGGGGSFWMQSVQREAARRFTQ